MRRKPFQEKAVEELVGTFKRLWAAPGDILPLVFKSPTGSGKTFMVESFMQELSTSGGFDEDIAWIWITFSEDLAMQSKSKFEEYFFPNVGRRLLAAGDFANEGVLKKGDVLFINWQKLVAEKADKRVLRRPDDTSREKESGWYFEDVVEATQRAGIRFAMVVDEFHKNETDKARKIVIEKVNPKVIVNVSATPTWEPGVSDVNHCRAGFVEVEREDVVAEGLIKEAIVSQTREEVEDAANDDDLDRKLIDMAMRRRDAVAADWAKAGSKVRPLILVQLPDERKDSATAVKIKKEVVLGYLKDKGVEEERIANWFDSGKDEAKLKDIAEPDSPIDFLLFKQAAGTGWDCPRAQILVMYRDIKSPVFKTQTLGRIIRNPEPEMDLSAFPALRRGYLYTNHSAEEVKAGEKDGSAPPIFAKKASLVLPIPDGSDSLVVHPAMTTDYVSRADYGDLGKSSAFQKSFVASMDAWFGIGVGDLMGARTEKVGAKGVCLDQSFRRSLIADAEWVSVNGDGGGANIDEEVSENDTERLFTGACESLLGEQTEEDAKIGNIARSIGPFRLSVRRWLAEALPDVASDTGRYKIFLADLAKGASSVFRPAITAALKDYAPERKANIEARKGKEEAKEAESFRLKREYGYSDDYEPYRNGKGEEPTLCAVKPFLLLPGLPGRANETAFVDFLESHGETIEWWFKNGNEGKDFFGLKYFNTADGADRLFYPDWIVKFKDGRIGIFDTKGGSTATHPEGRETGLREKIAAMNAATGCDMFFGGLVVSENGTWYCHDGKDYSYSKGKLGEGWKLLAELLYPSKKEPPQKAPTQTVDYSGIFIAQSYSKAAQNPGAETAP